VLQRHVQSAVESPRLLPRPISEATPIIGHVTTFLNQLLRQVASAAASTYARQQQRTATLLARACATPELEISDFIACAAALRRMVSSSESLLRHRLIEARNALRTSLWPALAPAGEYTDRVIAELLSGDTSALARSEIAWSRVLDVHRSQLSRAVYAHTGRHFRDWRRVCRLKRAAYLLGNNNEQAAQIAYQVGYRHTQTSQFTREFHQMFGVAPLVFRRLAQNA
jgi:AraC-like DNA-binding protein